MMRFKKNKNGTVTDTISHPYRYWEAEVHKNVTWEEAMKIPEELNARKFGGWTDWRLPIVQELVELLNYNKEDLASDFPDMPSELWFWSSSPVIGNMDYAWFVNFYDGHVNNNYKALRRYARCVRGGNIGK